MKQSLIDQYVQEVHDAIVITELAKSEELYPEQEQLQFAFIQGTTYALKVLSEVYNKKELK